MLLYLIRHGKADYSKIRKDENCSVANLAPLSAVGIEQAKNLQPYIEQLTEPIILSSPYTRTLQTAYIAGGNQRGILVDYRLREWMPDKDCQIKVDKIAERNNYFKTNTQNVNYEKENEMAKRFYNAIKDVIDLQKKINRDDTLVVFSHARVMESFMKEYCGEEIYLKNCQIAEIIYDKNKFNINRVF